jgi:tRNA(fMet)-specific endonuclease VapC
MKILDTDILVGALRGHKDATNKLETLRKSEEVLAITVFNEQEILFGALLVSKKAFESAKEFLDSFRKLNYEEKDMLQTIKIILSLEKKGLRVGVIDEMISGICLRHGATIVTRNISHFSKIRGLKVEEW